jgi:hypothetical protein
MYRTALDSSLLRRSLSGKGRFSETEGTFERPATVAPERPLMAELGLSTLYGDCANDRLINAGARSIGVVFSDK